MTEREARLRVLAGWLFDLARKGNPRSLRDIDLALRLAQAALALGNVVESLEA